LLFLATTHCVPAPQDNSGGSSGAGNTSVGGNGGNPQGGTTHAATGGTPQGGTTHSPQGGTTNYYPTGGTPEGGSTYVPQTGGTPEGGSTYVPQTGGTPMGGTTVMDTGGVTAVGGSTSGPPTCTTDLMTLRSGTSFNWIVTSPPTCSVQGSVYAYGDVANGTCTSPSPITASACTAASCCISGATVIDATSSKWGCGLGMDLNSSGGSSAIKSPYAGAAKGFKVTIAGTVATGQKIRIMYASTATPPTAGTAPYKEVDGVGTYSVLFSDATCPAWATGGKCTPVSGSGAYALQVQIPGGTAATDAVGPFSNVCITSIVPL
jgi:hypothetical protein